MASTLRPAAKVGLPAAVLLLVLPFVQHFEGRELKPYRDIGGVLTVCDGYAGPGIVPGKTYTPAECDAMTARSLDEHNAAIMGCASAKLEPHQHAAFLDFAYNVGPANFCTSTMARRINAGDIAGACAELRRWTFVKKRDCKDPANECGGIVRRRAKEQALCEGRATGLHGLPQR